jgi:hypothetical protein
LQKATACPSDIVFATFTLVKNRRHRCFFSSSMFAGLFPVLSAVGAGGDTEVIKSLKD